MELQQTKKPIHVGYEVHTQDTGGQRVKTLEIETPLWVLVVTQNLDSIEFYQLVDLLRTTFSYKDDEIVPLELPDRKIDFIMITQEADVTHKFGVSYIDADEGIAGHEYDIAQVTAKFCNDLNETMGIDNRGIGQIYSGTEYYTPALSEYVSNSDEINISIKNDDCVYNVTVDLRDLVINYVMFEEECIPSPKKNDAQ